MKEEKKEKLVVKPHYNIIFNFIDNHLSTMVIILVILAILIKKNELINYGIIIVSVYILYLLGVSIYNKIKYQNTIYSFYDNELKYRNKFKKEELETLEYTNIKQIRYSQTFLQSMFKIGTIIIYTNNKKITKKFVIIQGIKDVKLVYEKILKIISEVNKEEK